MSKTTQRNTLISRILNTLLQYEGDRCCLSDHVHGDINQLRYYMKRFDEMTGDHPYRYWTAKGYMFVELTEDFISINDETLADMDASIRVYCKTGSREVIGNMSHVAITDDLFDTAGTGPAPEYHALPMTHVSCDAPVIDVWIEGHVSLLDLTKHIDVETLEGAPNGPAPVIIKHTAEMIRK